MGERWSPSSRDLPVEPSRFAGSPGAAVKYRLREASRVAVATLRPVNSFGPCHWSSRCHRAGGRYHPLLIGESPAGAGPRHREAPGSGGWAGGGTQGCCGEDAGPRRTHPRGPVQPSSPSQTKPCLQPPHPRPRLPVGGPRPLLLPVPPAPLPTPEEPTAMRAKLQGKRGAGRAPNNRVRSAFT